VEFVDRVVVLHRLLAESDIPHALGGALALAYHASPRGTVEIDCNVFLSVSEAGRVTERLATLGIVAPPTGADLLPTDGLRCPWDDTHVDLFFPYDPEFFASVERRVECHAFENSEGRLVDLPFLSAEDLCVFKVILDRQKDWADIEAMLDEEPLDLAYVQRWLLHVRGDGIWPRLRRLAELGEASASTRP
jgi:hypothetical protein